VRALSNEFQEFDNEILKWGTFVLSKEQVYKQKIETKVQPKPE